ncbi:DMT family transporter [Tissierella carlieri]|uniref:DMT family transporter n=1 Tax=Tissierella carlieri TaxID=689904 RepID=UPI001C1214EA|nr:DMT family transporter [Tissierella carlieri]MBU5312875.1 DMT family transporter [Tissierella carlieri]MDU5082534.1 DMT family transporter [Bacillota bacterium]
MTGKKTLYADLSLLLVAVVWGSGFVVTKNALDHVTPYYLLFFRFIISTIILSVIFFNKIRKASIKDIKAGVIIGLFLFAGFAMQTVGLQYTEAGKQAFITATNVVMVPFIYWGISKKRPDKFDLAAAFLCLVGIGILSLNSNLTIGYGDFLTFLCAIMFACHISSTGYFAKESDPYVISIVQLGTAGILSFIFAILFEGTKMNIQTQTLIPILYLSLFSTMFAFLVQTVAQKYTNSTHAAIILSLEAVFGSTFAIIFLKEPFTVRFLIGCMAILISVITSETKWEFLKLKRD